MVNLLAYVRCKHGSVLWDIYTSQNTLVIQLTEIFCFTSLCLVCTIFTSLLWTVTCVVAVKRQKDLQFGPWNMNVLQFNQKIIQYMCYFKWHWWVSWVKMHMMTFWFPVEGYINIPVCVAALGVSSQRVPKEEANRQRGVLHCGNQDRFGQGVRHGVPGERWADSHIWSYTLV